MEATIRDLNDLSGIDQQLGEKTLVVAVSLASLERRRARLRKKIPGLLLASYDALARAGRRPVVVPLQNAHCSGCRLRLPPQLDSSIRRHRTLCPCPYCHRLLYAPAPAAGEGDGDPVRTDRRTRAAGTTSASARLAAPAKPVPHEKKSRSRDPVEIRTRATTRTPERAAGDRGAGADHVT